MVLWVSLFRSFGWWKRRRMCMGMMYIWNLQNSHRMRCNNNLSNNKPVDVINLCFIHPHPPEFAKMATHSCKKKEKEKKRNDLAEEWKFIAWLKRIRRNNSNKSSEGRRSFCSLQGRIRLFRLESIQPTHSHRLATLNQFFLAQPESMVRSRSHSKHEMLPRILALFTRLQRN